MKKLILTLLMMASSASCFAHPIGDTFDQIVNRWGNPKAKDAGAICVLKKDGNSMLSLFKY